MMRQDRIRAETLRIRESEFVQAAFALGLNPSRIIIRHVLLNAISPGLFEGDDTPWQRYAARGGIDAAKTVPAHRLGSPQEFGWAATFLCSPFPAYMTGAQFIIDGANSLRRGISGPPFQPVRSWAYESDKSQ